MPHYADRAKETSTSTGTGAITTSGVAASGGYQTIASGFGSSAGMVCYCIVNTNGEWETGCGMFNGTTGLTRDIPRDGSSGKNTLVNFSAGTKDVFITAISGVLANGGVGRQYAAARGLQMM